MFYHNWFGIANFKCRSNILLYLLGSCSGQSICFQVRKQIGELGFVSLPCGSQILNIGPQNWEQMPLTHLVIFLTFNDNFWCVEFLNPNLTTHFTLGFSFFFSGGEKVIPWLLLFRAELYSIIWEYPNVFIC